MPENECITGLITNLCHMVTTTQSKDLMISVSGIRGTVPDGLNAEKITSFAAAFAAVTGKKIVIGNDARPGGDAIKRILLGVLQMAGKEIVDVGLSPTPTVKAAVSLIGADAGIIITASHNPIQWNGLKFLKKGGFFFEAGDIDKWKKALAKQSYPAVKGPQILPVASTDAVAEHIRGILRVIPNVKKIRSKKYRILVDGVSGAGRQALPALLESLGCRVTRLYCEPHHGFPRPPEPTPSALREFSKQLKSGSYSAGFALDPDADRLVCGSKQEGAINEEYTLPLALYGYGLKAKGSAKGQNIVVNLSTSTLTDTVAAFYGFKVLRSAVGEANVVKKMKSARAVFGGEGNGGVIDPSIASYGRDSLSGAAWILSAMAAIDAKSINDLKNNLPKLYMSKEKIKIKQGSGPKLLSNIEKSFKKSAKVNKADGLHLQWQDGSWAHIRASNTEPVFRLICQANTAKELKELTTAIRRYLT